jgi:N-acetylglucosamine kinase-like BadF-type ATPase
VDRAAESGDVVAEDLLKGAAQNLATIAAVVRASLFDGVATASISYAGGVFRSPILLERFRMLIELWDEERFAAPLHGPAEGALIEAYRAAGIACTLKKQ